MVAETDHGEVQLRLPYGYQLQKKVDTIHLISAACLSHAQSRTLQLGCLVHELESQEVYFDFNIGFTFGGFITVSISSRKAYTQFIFLTPT